MAKVTILYWQSIPSVVEARDQNGVHKEMLSDQFQALIDSIAMKRDLFGTDEYLNQWQKGRPYQVEGSAQAAAVAVKDELESKFKEIRRQEMDQAKADGF